MTDPFDDDIQAAGDDLRDAADYGYPIPYPPRKQGPRMNERQFEASKALIERAKSYPDDRGANGFMYSNDELRELLGELSKGVAVGVHDVDHLGSRDGAVSVRITVYLTLDPEEYPWCERSSARWAERLDLMILDPDGWDRKNFSESWSEPITREEFMRRARRSTVDMKRFDELEAEARS